MPGRYRKLTCDDGRTASVTIFENFQQIMAGLVVERLKTPIIQDQELDVTEGALKPGIAAVAVSESEIGEQAGYPLIEDRAVIPAGLVPKRTGQAAFADAGRPAYRKVVMSINPVAADQLHEQRSIETALAVVIDILRHSLMTKLGEPQTGGKLAIVTRTPFSLQQKPESFGMGELLAFAAGEQFVEGFGHTGQAHIVQFIKCWMCKHMTSPQW